VAVGGACATAGFETHDGGERPGVFVALAPGELPAGEGAPACSGGASAIFGLATDVLRFSGAGFDDGKSVDVVPGAGSAAADELDDRVSSLELETISVADNGF